MYYPAKIMHFYLNTIFPLLNSIFVFVILILFKCHLKEDMGQLKCLHLFFNIQCRFDLIPLSFTRDKETVVLFGSVLDAKVLLKQCVLCTKQFRY